MTNKLKIVTAITGASGTIYAKLFLDTIINTNEVAHEELSLIISEQGKQVATHELGSDWKPNTSFTEYSNTSYYAPFASGSAGYDAMVIIPCSMGTLGRIASGTSNDLISRTADVMLKEKKKLILVIRESPYNLIHIKNMETVTLAGGIIIPASPSFYMQPESINDLVLTVVDRVIDHLGISHQTKRWKS
jgi:4-hydroxy-3-polyprenylbenzoate decarboxylase